MDLRAVRYALKDLLVEKTGVQVVPNPPRKSVTKRTIFFGVRSGLRETQDNGELCTFPVFVCLPSATDDQFDVLDEFIDGEKSIIDIIDANQSPVAGVTFTISGEWSEQTVEIGGTEHLACQFTVQARF